MVAVAQPFFKRNDSIPVIENNTTLPWAWAGGLDHAQFNNLDLNNDGTPDLVLLDKAGDKTLTFLRKPGTGPDQWEIAPRYREMFINQHTPRLRPHDWLLTRDFNCDGKLDIFTYSNGGVAIYRNDSQQNDTLVFTLMTPLLLSDYGSATINVYVSPVDLPAIDDFDGDGDLDMVTFSLQGTFAEYHRNRSKELYGHCDSLIFNLEDPCWGNFSEDPSTLLVSLNQTCKGGTGPGDNQGGPRHSGFTLLSIDIDADGDKDMVVSNISYPGMNLLTNGGAPGAANITAQDAQFPANTQNSQAVNLYNFPAAFAADVNNDGRSDLIASPYQENNGRNYDGNWLYLDQATTGPKNYSFERNNFMQHGMMEFGTGASPALADVSGDGLLDLIVGNKGYFEGTGNYQCKLAYYRNTGTATQPQFTLVTRDYANIAQLTLTNAAPTFGDLDADGDLDMLVGDGTGFVHFFRNNASATTEAQFTLAQPGYQGINVGQWATPQLIDIDSDGKLDLVMGMRSGILHYYRNTGTAQNPVFTLTDDRFGGIDVRDVSVSYGYSAPGFFWHGDTLKAFVGSETGDLRLFTGITETMALPETVNGTVGTGTTASAGASDTPFGFSSRSGRNQFLIKAEELSAAGFGAGLITKIGINVINATPFPLGQLRISLGNSTLTNINGFVEGLQTVFFMQGDSVFQGYNEFECQTPIAWDGTSNLVVQMCFYHVLTGRPDFQVQCTSTPFTSNAYATSTTTSGCNIAYVGSSSLRPNLTFSMKPTFPAKGKLPVYEGERLTVAIADVNADNLPDLILGNLAGGLSFYKGTTNGLSPNVVEAMDTDQGFDLTLFPNPTPGEVVIRTEGLVSGRVEISITDLMGRGVDSRIITSGTHHLNFNSLAPGTYLLVASSGNQRAHCRLVIAH